MESHFTTRIFVQAGRKELIARRKSAYTASPIAVAFTVNKNDMIKNYAKKNKNNKEGS